MLHIKDLILQRDHEDRAFVAIASFALMRVLHNESESCNNVHHRASDHIPGSARPAEFVVLIDVVVFVQKLPQVHGVCDFMNCLNSLCVEVDAVVA